MRLLLALSAVASLFLCSCKSTSQQQPKEDSKEAFLAIVDACYKAVYAGDWDKVTALRHPREIREMQALYRFNGLQWPPAKPAAADPARGVSDTFPDTESARLEIEGDWARLVYEGPDFNSLALFGKVDGRWLWVTSVTDHGQEKYDADGNCLGTPRFGPSRLHVWPVQEDRLWLPPVELAVQKGRAGEDALPRFEFRVRNTGTKPLTQWQMKAFFSSVSFRIESSHAGVPQRRTRGLNPDILVALSPGEQILLVDDISLTFGETTTPGKYTVRWYAGGHLSNEASVEVK